MSESTDPRLFGAVKYAQFQAPQAFKMIVANILEGIIVKSTVVFSHA